MESPHSILKKVSGYDSFRPGQEEIVSRLLAGQDVLAVMPTGAGKSICYQVPALLLPGITIVVSPLVSLMKDQVGALVQAGVAAAFLNNSLTDNQKALMLRRAREGWYKIIYVAPERLEMPGFQRFAQEREISMVTVDEAHCISQWGQDFRPSYLRILDFIDSLPRRPIVSAPARSRTTSPKRCVCATRRSSLPGLTAPTSTTGSRPPAARTPLWRTMCAATPARAASSTAPPAKTSMPCRKCCEARTFPSPATTRA